MTVELKDLDVEHFEPLVGETFRVGDYDIQLKEIAHGPETPPRFRQQFSLLFRYPEGFPQDSAVVSVSHPSIGTHDMFVNKVLGWEDEFDLEIVFN